MATVAMKRTVDEVPDAMKRLASLIARGFYGPEHGIVVDLLKRQVAMREEDLRAVLRLDIKQLRALLVQLKRDMLVKERAIASIALTFSEVYENFEEREEGSRPVKTFYYFLNYRSLLNVTKYKLDHMRRKLESEDKTATNRAAYRCQQCQKPFSDLDIGQLMDFATGEMVCFVCKGAVIEDPTAGPSQDTRCLLAKFNEEMSPLFGLLQELDGIQLAPHLLEPPPPAAPSAPGAEPEASANGSRGGGGGGGGGGRRPEFELYKSGPMAVEVVQGRGAGAAESLAPAKETPLWLQNITTPGAGTVVGAAEVEAPGAVADGGLGALGSPSRESMEDRVAATLRAHEALSSPTQGMSSPTWPSAPAAVGGGAEEAEEEEEEEEEEVEVGGERLPLFTVLADPAPYIARMSAAEKEAYIAASQRAMAEL